MKSLSAGLFGILFLFKINVSAQNDEFFLSGFITDGVSGEALLGTNILLYKDSLNLDTPPLTGTATNKFGYYVIPSLAKGTYFIITRHLGYKTNLSEIEITGTRQSETFSVELFPEDIELEEVIVEGKRKKEIITSTVDVSPELLAKLPTLTGEIDLFKSLELLPGVNKSSEISSGLYVRGGSPDQTLTLVDGVIVYNPAHLGNIYKITVLFSISAG